MNLSHCQKASKKAGANKSVQDSEGDGWYWNGMGEAKQGNKSRRRGTGRLQERADPGAMMHPGSCLPFLHPPSPLLYTANEVFCFLKFSVCQLQLVGDTL